MGNTLGETLRTMKKKFRWERDFGNGHYTYLIPLDEETFNFVSAEFYPMYDGYELSAVIILYNGRIINQKNHDTKTSNSV